MMIHGKLFRYTNTQTTHSKACMNEKKSLHRTIDKCAKALSEWAALLSLLRSHLLIDCVGMCAIWKRPIVCSIQQQKKPHARTHTYTLREANTVWRIDADVDRQGAYVTPFIDIFFFGVVSPGFFVYCVCTSSSTIYIYTYITFNFICSSHSQTHKNSAVKMWLNRKHWERVQMQQKNNRPTTTKHPIRSPNAKRKICCFWSSYLLSDPSIE